MSGSLLLLISLLAAPSHADTTNRGGSRDTLVLAHEFTAATEFARVTLDADQVYRVEVMDGSQVQVRALEPGAQNPLFNRIEAFPRASRTVAFELAPSVTTVYEIRVGGITRGAAAMRVYWDHHATARRQKVIAE